LVSYLSPVALKERTSQSFKMDSCDINDLSESIKSIASGTWSNTGVMIYWSPDFSPRTPNYKTIMIDALIDEVYGLEIIDDTDEVIFKLGNNMITMDWDVDFYASESWFSFTFIDYEQVETTPMIYNNRWFANE
jgi:hypothetical protein